MLRRNRIPEKDTEFSNYIYRTTAALLSGTPPSWQRLHLLESDKNKWIDFMHQWDDLYPKHINISTRTHTITREKNKLRNAFIKFANPLLNQLSGSYATEGDRLIFNLCKKNRPYTKRGKIEDIPSVSIETLGGTRLKFRVRRETQEGRRGKHPLADVLEIRYALFPKRKDNVKFEQCTETYCSTKTYFIFKLPESASRQWAYFYFRWRNLVREENSGPYSNMLMAYVS